MLALRFMQGGDGDGAHAEPPASNWTTLEESLRRSVCASTEASSRTPELEFSTSPTLAAESLISISISMSTVSRPPAALGMQLPPRALASELLRGGSCSVTGAGGPSSTTMLLLGSRPLSASPITTGVGCRVTLGAPRCDVMEWPLTMASDSGSSASYSEGS